LALALALSLIYPVGAAEVQENTNEAAPAPAPAPAQDEARSEISTQENTKEAAPAPAAAQDGSRSEVHLQEISNEDHAPVHGDHVNETSGSVDSDQVDAMDDVSVIDIAEKKLIEAEERSKQVEADVEKAKDQMNIAKAMIEEYSDKAPEENVQLAIKMLKEKESELKSKLHDAVKTAEKEVKDAKKIKKALKGDKYTDVSDTESTDDSDTESTDDSDTGSTDDSDTESTDDSDTESTDASGTGLKSEEMVDSASSPYSPNQEKLFELLERLQQMKK